jgi:alpha-1,3-rhamnosyltransferase
MLLPLVSILIPSYNHSKYVVETLNSVLEDTYPNKEIIIIDDGSKDNSVDIIQKWIDENSDKIKVHFLNRNNKGICATLNEMLKLKSGKYIQLLASDDLLYGGNLRERIEILESQESNGVLALCADALIIDKNGSVLDESYILKYYPKIYNIYKNKNLCKVNNEILRLYFICAPSVLLNSRIYDELGFYNEKLVLEDKFFYTEAVLKGFLLFINKPVVKYRIHEFNTSGAHISVESRLKLVKSEIKGYLSLFFKFFKLYFLYKYIYNIIYFVKLKFFVK